jgi:hypothetical protein
MDGDGGGDGDGVRAGRQVKRSSRQLRRRCGGAVHRLRVQASQRP